jgi:hypothetical protein
MKSCKLVVTRRGLGVVLPGGRDVTAAATGLAWLTPGCLVTHSLRRTLAGRCPTPAVHYGCPGGHLSLARYRHRRRVCSRAQLQRLQRGLNTPTTARQPGLTR